MQCVICDMWYAICDMQCVICNVWYAMCDMRYVICNVWHAICDMHGSMRVRRQKRFSGLWVPVQWFASCVTRGFSCRTTEQPSSFLATPGLKSYCPMWPFLASSDGQRRATVVWGGRVRGACRGKNGWNFGNDSNGPWPSTSIGEKCCTFFGTRWRFPVLSPL